MANEQTVPGYFKRVVSGAALHLFPFYYNMIRYNNIFETIEGIDGIYIYKQADGDGSGWKIGLNRYADGYTEPAQAWDIAFVDNSGTWTATVSNGTYMRRGVTKFLDDLEIEMPADPATETYIAVKIDLELGTGILVEDDDRDALVDTYLPLADEGFIYLILYHCSKPDSDYNWFADIDYRHQFTLPNY